MTPNLMEAAAAPIPMLSTTKKAPAEMTTEQPEQQQQQPMRRRHRRRHLAQLEELAAKAEAPSAFVVAAAPPSPFLFSSPPSTSISLAEMKKQNVQSQSKVSDSVYDALSKNREYSDLKQLVDNAGLASELGPGFSGTLFAPSNAAFDEVARAGGPKLSDFLSSANDLKKLVLFHVVQQKLTPGELTPGKILETKLPGAKLEVVQTGEQGGVEVKPASYNAAAAGPAGPDVTAGNAALFPVNKVL